MRRNDDSAPPRPARGGGAAWAGALTAVLAVGAYADEAGPTEGDARLLSDFVSQLRSLQGDVSYEASVVRVYCHRNGVMAAERERPRFTEALLRGVAENRTPAPGELDIREELSRPTPLPLYRKTCSVAQRGVESIERVLSGDSFDVPFVLKTMDVDFLFVTSNRQLTLTAHSESPQIEVVKTLLCPLGVGDAFVSMLSSLPPESVRWRPRGGGEVLLEFADPRAPQMRYAVTLDRDGALPRSCVLRTGDSTLACSIDYGPVDADSPQTWIAAVNQVVMTGPDVLTATRFDVRQPSFDVRPERLRFAVPADTVLFDFTSGDVKSFRSDSWPPWVRSRVTPDGTPATDDRRRAVVVAPRAKHVAAWIFGSIAAAAAALFAVRVLRGVRR